jgi:hypothetical protein
MRELFPRGCFISAIVLHVCVFLLVVLVLVVVIVVVVVDDILALVVSIAILLSRRPAVLVPLRCELHSGRRHCLLVARHHRRHSLLRRHRCLSTLSARHQRCQLGRRILQ